MSQVTVFSCDLCKAEYREGPHPSQQSATQIMIPGVGPVDQPMGKTVSLKWNDLCPPCATQLRDITSRFISARKGGLDVRVIDSTSSEYDGAKAEREVKRAESNATKDERARVERVVASEVASQQTIIDGGNEEPIPRSEVVRLLQRIVEAIKSGKTNA